MWPTLSKTKSGSIGADDCSDNNRSDVVITESSTNSLANTESIFEFFFLSLILSIWETLSNVACGCTTNDLNATVCSKIEEVMSNCSERKIVFPKTSDVDMIVGLNVGASFCGAFDAIPTDSCKDTEMFLDSFGVEETVGDISVGITSCPWTSVNPNGTLDVIKNKIVIRAKTDFNWNCPQHKKLQKFLGVEFDLQEFGVDCRLGDWINWSDYLLDSLRYPPHLLLHQKKLIHEKQ